MTTDEDPHPNHSRFVGRPIAFDHPAGKADARRLVGVVESQRYIGRTQRGDIPDYELVVRGKSGAAMTISLVESYAQFPDPT